MSDLSHAMLLTAGLGTRLRPLTHVRAKAALPVAGEPLVRRIIGWLGSEGVTELTLNLHHLPATIAAVVGDGRDLGARVRYSWEHPTVLGSAGGVRQALDIVGTDTFFIVNGDTLTDVRLQPLARAHRESGALVTIAVVPNVEYLKYGGLRLDRDGAYLGVTPRGPAAAGTFHVIGVQVAHRDAFQGVERGQVAQSIGGVYDRLIADRPGAVRAVTVEAGFMDIGTVADYWQTSHALAGDAHEASRQGRVSPTARVIDSILWDGVHVDEGATLEECIVTDNVQVPAGANYRRSILRRDINGLLVVDPLELA